MRQSRNGNKIKERLQLLLNLFCNPLSNNKMKCHPAYSTMVFRAGLSPCGVNKGTSNDVTFRHIEIMVLIYQLMSGPCFPAPKMRAIISRDRTGHYFILSVHYPPHDGQVVPARLACLEKQFQQIII